MLDLFRTTLARSAHEPALIYFNSFTTYAELDAQSDAVAVWLEGQGTGHGDRVAIIAQNLPAFVVFSLAAWKIGAVPTPGNPMYRGPEMARILGDAQPSAVLYQDCDAQAIDEALALAGLENIARAVVSPRGDGKRALPFETILAEHNGRTPSKPDLAPGDLGLLLYTSGTTGAPKGAMLSHSSLAFNAAFMRDWSGLTGADTLIGIAPLFHITGFVCQMCAAFACGGALVLNYRFEPNVVLDMIRSHRPTFAIGAITAYNALSRLDHAKPADMTSLVKVFSGGAPIPPSLRDGIAQRLGLRVQPCYGMTETAAPAVFTPLDGTPPERDEVLSIGVAIPETEIIFVDDAGKPAAACEVGELFIRGPQVMTGYWRNPSETGAALADGWLRTGDVGFRDDKGWIYLVDRKKDVIIASGFKVWPREVEDVLYEHPSVREAAVVGVPDGYRGETVKACISLIEGRTVSSEEVVRHCKDRLAAYKTPKIVEIHGDLPKTATGKIQRAALRG